MMALLANINRDPKKTPAFSPRDFSPVQLASGPKPRPPRVGVEILRQVFIDGKGAKQ